MPRIKKQTIEETDDWDLKNIETESNPVDAVINETSTSGTIPTMEEPEWHDYVMSNFSESELVNDCPTVAGLRRVAQKLLGEIVFSGPIQVFAPNSASGTIDRATIVYKIDFAWKYGVSFSNITLDRFSFPTKTFIEVSDVWSGNAEYKYAVHTTSLASTRAEGRALRKALQLRTVAAEELSTNAVADLPTDNEGMTNNQRMIIEAKCGDMGVDLVKLAAHIGLASNSISWTKADAAKIMAKINSWQTDISGNNPIPEEVKK